MTREISQRFIALRQSHPAWLLLASRNGPLILASLKAFWSANSGDIEFDAAVERLASVFADHSNDAEFELGDDLALTAKRELRQWIKRGLIVERDGRLLATDALQRAMQFLDSLELRTMTSTASRLATVQRAIEDLHEKLSPDRTDRERSLQGRIEALTEELEAVRAGDFEVLDGPQAEEGVREVFQLAISLQADFRRVEDSYREADRTLRQRIIGEKHHRGEIVDELLGSHDALLQTPEGQVFESFHQQLVKPTELDRMKSRLRSILSNGNTEKALRRRQRVELRRLVSRLVQDSERVIQARAKSERDVRSFLKAGFADELFRVGALLQDVFQAALYVDWQSQSVRRAPSPLPPVAVAIPNLPLVERLLVKQVDGEAEDDLDLTLANTDPAAMDPELLQAFHSLDRESLFAETIEHLRAVGTPLTIGQLARSLPPFHDLETLVYWLVMARQAGIDIGDQAEAIDLFREEEGMFRFLTPHVELSYEPISKLNPEALE